MSHSSALSATPSSGLDYYHILQLKRSAAIGDIHHAYRRLALQLHPHANVDASTEKQNEWLYLNEAYRVLTSPKLRAIYDQYGYKVLRQGNASLSSNRAGHQPLSLLSTGAPKRIRIHGWSGITVNDANKQFEDFFGTASPFSVFNNIDLPLSVQPPITTPTMPPQHINVYVSLEELYTGIEKQIKVYTYVMEKQKEPVQTQEEEKQQHDTITSNEAHQDIRVLQEKVLTLHIGAGWKTGTQYTYKHEGDQQYGYHPGDIICTLVEKEHPRFRRKNNHLIYKQTLTLLHALTGTTVDVETLDHRILPISLHDMICTPTNQTVISNEGMPISEKGGSGSDDSRSKKKRGDLYIEFDIVFPSELSLQQKNTLKQVLQ